VFHPLLWAVQTGCPLSFAMFARLSCLSLALQHCFTWLTCAATPLLDHSPAPHTGRHAGAVAIMGE